MRVGLLGGAFNPPHLGHLILAQEAIVQLGLERVVFMPYAEPSHRVLEDDPGPEVRKLYPDAPVDEGQAAQWHRSLSGAWRRHAGAD